MKYFLALLLATFALPANADPISFIAAYAIYAIETYGVQALILALSFASYENAARKARHARQDAINDYNAKLTDVGQVTLVSNPDVRDIYGTATVGGYVVAVFTTDKVALDTNGHSYTKPDGYKHLVIAICRGPINAITDVLLNGKTIGPLDSNGFGTADNTAVKPEIKQATVIIGSGGTVVAPFPILSIIGGLTVGGATASTGQADGATIIVGSVSVGLDHKTITGPPNTIVTYTYDASIAVIKVTKHLGTLTQVADTALINDTVLLPNGWKSTCTGTGWAYVVVKLDLESEIFQQGVPDLTFTVKGLNVYDPRSDTRFNPDYVGSRPQAFETPSTWLYTSNAALVTAAYLMSDIGYSVDPSDSIDWQSVVVAASESDLTMNPTYINDDGIPINPGFQPNFTVNGVISSTDDPVQVLSDLSTTMAGSAVYGDQWSLYTGTWRPPIDTLNDDDLDGQISVLETGVPLDQLFNGIHGTYVNGDDTTPQDSVPYQNSTYVTADGKFLWADITFPYTRNGWSVGQLCRILTEQNRLGLVISYPAKMYKWPLRVGDRVYVNNEEYGYENKSFLITGWQWGITTPVTLTMVEDEAGVYDTIDSTLAHATNLPNLPDPYVVAGLQNFQAESGDQWVRVAIDGTVVPRVHVTWDRVGNPYASAKGYIVIQWNDTRFLTTGSMHVSADDTDCFIDGLQVGQAVFITGYVWNGFVSGPNNIIGHLVGGITQTFEEVAGLGAISDTGGIINVVWDEPTNPSWGVTEVRYGGSWDGGIFLFSGQTTHFAWANNTAGSYQIWAQNFDRSGNGSEPQFVILDYVPVTGTVPEIKVQGDNNAHVSSRFLDVNGDVILSGWSEHGHQFWEIDPADGSIVSTDSYDTYGGSTTALIAAIAAVPVGHIIVLASGYGTQCDAPLRDAINAVGGQLTSTVWTASFTSHVFIGQVGFIRGQGYEAMSTASAAVLSAFYSVTSLVTNSSNGGGDVYRATDAGPVEFSNTGTTEGPVINETFTALQDGVVKVTCNFTADSTVDSDFGPSVGHARTYITVDGTTTTFGPSQFLASSRFPFTMVYAFNVLNGNSIEAGLYANIGISPSTSHYWDVVLIVEFTPNASV